MLTEERPGCGSCSIGVKYHFSCAQSQESHLALDKVEQKSVYRSICKTALVTEPIWCALLLRERAD